MLKFLSYNSCELGEILFSYKIHYISLRLCLSTFCPSLYSAKMETINDEVLRGNQLDVPPPPSQSSEQYICAARNHMSLSESYPHHCPSFSTDIRYNTGRDGDDDLFLFSPPHHPPSFYQSCRC